MPINIQQATSELERIRQSADALENTRSQFLTAQRELTTIIANNNPVPQYYAGLVEGYRYTTGKKGEFPSHRFEVRCGNGIVLHIECRNNVFENVMVNMDMGEVTPSKINGKLITLELISASLVPTRMWESDNLARDRWNNYLYETCRAVYINTGQTVEVEDIDPDDNYINVRDLSTGITIGDSSTRFIYSA